MNIDTPKTYNHPEIECSSSAARGPGCQDRDWSPRPDGSKLRQLHSPHFWEVTLNTVGPLYLMSITGNVEYPTQGNGKKRAVDSQRRWSQLKKNTFHFGSTRECS